jgi:hypothetical protein
MKKEERTPYGKNGSSFELNPDVIFIGSGIALSELGRTLLKAFTLRDGLSLTLSSNGRSLMTEELRKMQEKELMEICIKRGIDADELPMLQLKFKALVRQRDSTLYMLSWQTIPKNAR